MRENREFFSKQDFFFNFDLSKRFKNKTEHNNEKYKVDLAIQFPMKSI